MEKSPKSPASPGPDHPDGLFAKNSADLACQVGPDLFVQEMPWMGGKVTLNPKGPIGAIHSLNMQQNSMLLLKFEGGQFVLILGGFRLEKDSAAFWALSANFKA